MKPLAWWLIFKSADLQPTVTKTSASMINLKMNNHTYMIHFNELFQPLCYILHKTLTHNNVETQLTITKNNEHGIKDRLSLKWSTSSLSHLITHCSVLAHCTLGDLTKISKWAKEIRQCTFAFCCSLFHLTGAGLFKALCQAHFSPDQSMLEIVKICMTSCYAKLLEERLFSQRVLLNLQ